MLDLSDFVGFATSLDIEQLRECCKIMNNEIVKKLSPENSQNRSSTWNIGSNTSLQPADCKSVESFVEYRTDFISNEVRDSLLAECSSLSFLKRTKSDTVQNRFVSALPESYTWPSAKGPVVNKALPFNSYPVLKDLLGKVNLDFNCDLNSVLVSYYKDGTVNARLHSDDEDQLDSSQPIIVVSIGAVRKVQFVDNNQESFRLSALTLNPADCSVYVMRSGCQQAFRHRVIMNKKEKNERISFSFRAFVTNELTKGAGNSSTCNSTPSIASFKTPPSSLVRIVKSVSGSQNFAPSSSIVASKAECTPQATTSPITSRPRQPVASQFVPLADGFSPFHTKSVSFNMSSNSTSHQLPKANEKLCLLLGSSITEGVDGNMMSRKSRTVINLSTSGARIADVSKLAKDFFIENPESVDKVDKIIINVGTNEIKYFNSQRFDVFKSFRSPLINLVKSLKYMFHRAQIIFVPVLPFQRKYKYTAASVHQYNQLLLQVCEQYGCVYFDCFSEFLVRMVGPFGYGERWDFNQSLYWGNIHLNDNGLRVLCRALKYIIYGNACNPFASIFYNPDYYY